MAGSWVLYDLANTIYSASVGYLLVPMVADAYDGRTALGLTQTVSMVLAGLLLPVLGSLCDRTGQTRGFLVLFTGLCVGGMAGFGLVDSLPGVVLAFFVGNVGFQAALVTYNALLPSVATPQRTGWISGLGVGLGYLGVILTLAVLLPLSELAAVGPRGAFLLGAAAFAVLALPCLLLVRDRTPSSAAPLGWAVVGDSLGAVLRTLRGLPEQRALMLFLIGNLFLTDVLNTAILFFADMTQELFAEPFEAGRLSLFGHGFPPPPPEAEDRRMTGFVVVLGLALNTLALVFGLLLGWLSDRWDPLKVMRLCGIALAVGLAGGALFGGRSAEGYLALLVVGGAFGLAGVWTAGRKALLQLAPPDKLRECFGLYGLTQKLSVIGSTTFAVLADTAGVRTALLAQGVQIALGLACLWLIPTSGAEEPQPDEAPVDANERE